MTVVTIFFFKKLNIWAKQTYSSLWSKILETMKNPVLTKKTKRIEGGGIVVSLQGKQDDESRAVVNILQARI